MDDDTCPVCKSTRYLNPSMKILVSLCHHKMCNTCVDRLFFSGTAPCPVCNATLRRSDFNVQIFEDLVVEKECRIRRAVSQIMNKIEDDFDNIEEYNDYLELMEDYVFGLLKDENNKYILSKLDEFKRKNINIIEKNMIKKMSENKQVGEYINREDERKRKLYEEDLRSLEKEVHERGLERERIIEEISKSDQPASLLLAKKRVSSHTDREKNSLQIPIHQNIAPIQVEDHDQFHPLDIRNNSSVTVILESTYFDPIIENWIDQPEVRAGGCIPNIYHERAIYYALSGVSDAFLSK